VLAALAVPAPACVVLVVAVMGEALTAAAYSTAEAVDRREMAGAEDSTDEAAGRKETAGAVVQAAVEARRRREGVSSPSSLSP
jgi:hypothetical protein